LYGAGASCYGHFADDKEINPEQLHEWRKWEPLKHFVGTVVIAMAASEFHGVAVTEDRKVYSWGVNSLYGSGDDYCDGILLGYNTSSKAVDRGINMHEKVLWTEPKPQLIPRSLGSLEKLEVRQVACGTGHTLALTDGGDVYSWGSGWAGCLGHGQGYKNQLVPIVISALRDVHIIQIACGNKNSIAVTTTGYLYAWGSNSHGQIGVGDNETRDFDSPQQVKFDGPGPVCVVQAVFGQVHCLALDVRGRVFTWGSNLPLKSSSSTLIGRLGLGVPHILRPQQVTAGSMADATIKMVAAGTDHSLALSMDGLVIFWGFLRRPKDWAEEGYGPVAAATQLLPKVIHGPWETASGRVTFISSGANKCMILAERNADLMSLPLDMELLMASNEIGSANDVRPEREQLEKENNELKKQLAEARLQLAHAQTVFAKYLPTFSVALSPSHR